MGEEPPAGPNRVVDLAGLANSGVARKPLWSFQGTDLNLNLIALAAGESIEEHANRQVEVLLLGVAGDGEVVVDGVTHLLGPAAALVVPKGARRSIKAGKGPFSYLTCHVRRAGLLPTVGRAGAPRGGG